MSEIVTPILEWLNAHPELAGLATFLISAGESVAIIGTIVPGSVMMTAIGALVGAGIIPIWSTLIWAILGAIVGDGISYWMGYYFKDRLHNIWPFRTHPNLLKSGTGFFTKYGGMSVFIGRFVGPVRALVPVVAGMLGVRPLIFTIANISSAILWAPVYMLPGFILGAASTELPSELAGRLILIFLLGLLFLILIIWLAKKLLDLVHQEIDQMLTLFWISLKKSRHFYLITTILKHYDTRKTYGQLKLVFYFIVVLLLFIYLSTFVFYDGPHGQINNLVFHVSRSLRSPTVDSIMLPITLLGDKYFLLPVSLLLAAWLSWKKRWHTAWHILALGLLSGISIELIKNFIHSPRPWGVVNNTFDSYSFPSGHVTLACAFYFGFALLLIKAFKIKHRSLVYIPTIILVSAIALSRLYFGVHWFTDVLGGALLGFAVLMIVVLSYNRKMEKRIKSWGMVLAVCLASILCYSFNLYYQYPSLKSRYQLLNWPVYNIRLQSWWEQEGEHFPLYRVNRFGLSVNVFNIQWIDHLDTIKDLLLKNGWEHPPERDWASILYRLTAVQSTEHLPLMSPLYLDQPPVLTLIKYYGKDEKLIILRFWKSQFLFEHISEPLWLGTLDYAPSTYSWLFKKKHSYDDVTPSASLLFNSIPSIYDIKETTVIIRPSGTYSKQQIMLIKPKILHFSQIPVSEFVTSLSTLSVSSIHSNAELMLEEDNYRS